MLSGTICYSPAIIHFNLLENVSYLCIPALQCVRSIPGRVSVHDEHTVLANIQSRAAPRDLTKAGHDDQGGLKWIGRTYAQASGLVKDIDMESGLAICKAFLSQHLYMYSRPVMTRLPRCLETLPGSGLPVSSPPGSCPPSSECSGSYCG